MALAAASALGGEAPEHPLVPTRPLGKTGVDVSTLSFGCFRVDVSKQMLLKKSLEWGVTHWDTAHNYGTEPALGKYFEKWPEDRKRVFLATKSWTRDPKDLSRELAQSLRDMKTDHVDLLYIHRIDDVKEMSPEKVKAWKEWAAANKADGKFRLLGFTSHDSTGKVFIRAAELGLFDAAMLMYNYRLLNNEGTNAAIDACAKAGMGVVAIKLMGAGPIEKAPEAERRLAEPFQKRGFSPEQAMIKAVLEKPGVSCVCVGMPNLEMLEADIAAVLDKTKLTAEDKALLEQHARETCSSYCAGCGSLCQPAIANAVPVSDIMRLLMYYRSYKDPDLARRLFAELPRDARDRLAAVDYSSAERCCPQRLPIARLMREAARILA